jgi:hypothetical protein
MEKIVFIDQSTGAKRETVIDPPPVCPDCPEAAFAGGLGAPRYRRSYQAENATLVVRCGACGRQLGEYAVAQAGA